MPCIYYLWVWKLLNSVYIFNLLLILFSVSFSEVFQYTMISENRDSFNSSLPIHIPLKDFSCLIALANTSSIVSNLSRNCGHSCLVPDLSGNTSTVSPLNEILTLGLRCVYIYNLLRKYSSVYIECFSYEWVLNFLKGFFSIYRKIIAVW